MHKIDINLRISKQFLLLYVGLLVGSLGIIQWLPFVGWVKALMALFTLSYIYLIIHRQKQWVAVGHDQAGWHFQYGKTSWLGTLCNDSTVTQWVSILRFIPVDGDGKKRSCVVFKDMMEPEKYRQLLVRARYYKTKLTL